MAINKRTKQVFLGIIIVGLLVGSWSVWYVFFKPHRDVSGEKPAYTMTADELNAAFDQPEALTTYIDKAVLVEGTITEADSNHIALGSVICNFEQPNASSIASVKPGDKVKVQGRVSTFNDLMGEIVIDKCALK